MVCWPLTDVASGVGSASARAGLLSRQLKGWDFQRGKVNIRGCAPVLRKSPSISQLQAPRFRYGNSYEQQRRPRLHSAYQAYVARADVYIDLDQRGTRRAMRIMEADGGRCIGGDSEMPKGMDSFRWMIAALLALALLVLPTPLRHASAASLEHRHAARQCAECGEAAPGDGATFMAVQCHDCGGPRGHHEGLSGLACCGSARCSPMVATPPMPPVHPPLLLSGSQSDGFAVPDAPDGTPVGPAFRPPRARA